MKYHILYLLTFDELLIETLKSGLLKWVMECYILNMPLKVHTQVRIINCDSAIHGNYCLLPYLCMYFNTMGESSKFPKS